MTLTCKIFPGLQRSLLTDTRFSVEVLGATCRAKLLSAEDGNTLAFHRATQSNQLAKTGLGSSMRRHRDRTSTLGALFAAVWAILLLSAAAVAQTAGRVNVLQPTHQIGGAKRLALVIGNASYRNVTALKNPVNDARAVAERLRSVGYEVYLALDVDRDGMNDAIDGFLKHIEPGSETLVYYAGHGMEVQEVLGVRAHATLDEAEIEYRRRAKVSHPDNGGSAERMAELNAAIAEARRSQAA
jgi:hypothetical protein